MAPALERRAAIAVAVWAAAFGALALNRLMVGVFYDDGLYAGLAASLATGGYHHPHLPGSPAAIHYPPIYPLVLAPLYGFLSRDAAALAGKLLNIVFGALAAGLITLHATRLKLVSERAPWWIPGVVVALAAAAVPVLTTQSVLFAEPLFGVLLALTVMYADRASDPGNPSHSPEGRGSEGVRTEGSGEPGVRRWALIAGLFAALTLLTRTIGIAAGAGALVYMGVRTWQDRPKHYALLLRAGIPIAVAALGWLAWTMIQRGGIDPALAINYGSYGEVLRQTGLGALGSAIADLPRPLYSITLAWLPRGLALAMGVAAAATSLYGLWLLCRRSSIGFTLIAYLAILAIWPFPPDRFLWAILPWLGLAFAAGIGGMFQYARLRVPGGVLAGLALVGFGIYEVYELPRRAWAAQASAISANFGELLPKLRELPDNAVLAVDNESLVWLYSGRRAVPLFIYGYSGAALTYPNPAEHRAYLERQGVTHIVLASSSSPAAKQLRALILLYPDWLKASYGWPGGRWIFEVMPRALPPTP